MNGHVSALRRVAHRTLGTAIRRPSKIVCVDSIIAITRPKAVCSPFDPVLFFQATSSLVGPNDAL